MGSQLLAVFDPSRRLGLTDPSPGGGIPPLRYRCGGIWRRPDHLETCDVIVHRDQILVLRTEADKADPSGLARGRDVLARAILPAVRAPLIEDGVVFGKVGDRAGALRVGAGNDAVAWYDVLLGESTPEALARLLAEHTGCEVIRGT